MEGVTTHKKNRWPSNLFRPAPPEFYKYCITHEHQSAWCCALLCPSAPRQPVAPSMLEAKCTRAVSGSGPSMVLEIRVSVGGANHTILNRRWRDLISLEAALVRERMLRGPLMLATGRTVTAEARRAAADAFLARLVNNADALPPHSLLEFLDIADAAAVVGTAQTQRFTMEQQQQQQQQQPARALPPAPRVQLFSRSAWAEQRRGGSRCGKPPTASTLIAAPSPEVVPSGPGSVNHGNHRDDRLIANNHGVSKTQAPTIREWRDTSRRDRPQL